ncbi:hypothetical protein J7L67_04140, partial [bacterium]|nr:hypothetical protein [bacterium]
MGQLRVYLVKALFSNILVQPTGAEGEIGIINIDDMPDKVRSFFNEPNIGTLIAEPTLSLETVNRLVDVLASRNSKSVLSEGVSIALSENAQLNVFRSTDTKKLVVHVMNKPSTGQQAGYETVSESIQRKIRLKNYPLSPADEKSELIFETRSLIDEFNAAYSGNFSIVTDTDYITVNTQNALNFMLFMAEKLDTAKIADAKTVQRRKIIEKFFLAKDFFKSGDIKQTLALITSIQQQADELALFTDKAVAYNLEYDIKQLNKIVTGTVSYDESELFFALDKIIENTLNQAESAFYLPLLLSLGNYLEGDIKPVSGVTDVNIYLKTDVFEDEIADPELRHSFYTEGVTLYNEKLYVNVALFDVTLPKNMETLSDMLKSANTARNEALSRKALSLIAAGLPEDMRLLRFSEDALSPFRSDMYLNDGFSTQNISLSEEDFGMEIPVSLNPTLYAKTIKREQTVFKSVLTLVNESARLLRAKKKIQPKQLLMQAQFMIANLKHFSPRFKADLIKAIAADIRNIERTNRNKNPLPPALLLSGRRSARYSKLKDTRKDALTAKLVKTAFFEIEKVNSELASEIKANMNIVVGYWPDVDMEQSTVPYNTVYIYPHIFKRIKFLAGKEKTFGLAAIQLAKQITDFQNNTRSLNIADFLDEFQLDPDKANEFIEHTQEFITDATDNYTGKAVSYIDVKYDKSGRPLFDINGARIVTYFDGGRPVRVWNSSDNKEYYLPIPFEDSEIKGYEVIRDETGNILSLKTPSELEKWIGYLKPAEKIFFLAKDKYVIAIVNPTDEGVNIIPIVPDEKLVQLLGAQNVEQAMKALSKIVEKRNKTLIEDGKLWDIPQSKFNPRRRRWNKNRILAVSMLIPIVVLNFAGCVSSPIHNPQFRDPYTQTPAIFDRPAITDEDLSAPYDILDFIGTSGDLDVDQQAAQEFTRETIDLLQNLRSSLQTELAALENEANPDTTRTEDLQRRIALLDSTIENLQINVFEVSAVPPSRIPIDGQDLPSAIVDQQLDTRRLAHPLPAQLLELTSLMLNNLDYQRTLDSLSEFSAGLIVRQGDYRGLARSYQPNTEHPDYQYLAQYARVAPYDVAVSIFADLSNNDNASANRKVEALLRLIQIEQSSGFNGVVHFNYNTSQDNYIDPRAPLGNTAWTLKAIYAYALVTGDTAVIEGANTQILQTAMDFVLSQQVMNNTDPRYGLFRAGVHSAQTDGYGVMGSQHIQYEEIITEHLADIHDLLNLAYQVTGDETYRQRRELMDRQILDKMLVEDAQTAYFVPNINAQGEAGTGVAIDDLTWAGSMVLSMDHLSLERRLEIVRKLINYVDRNFIVEHNGTTGAAQSVELTDEFITSRSETPSNAIVGTKFFDGFFEDEFIERMNWDDPEVMSVQIEATLGYIHLLYQTAAVTPDTQTRQALINRMVFLMNNVHRFYHQQTEDGGIPYASRSLHGVQTTMESLIASESFRTVMGIWDNPELMWTFIGVPEQSFVNIQPGDEQTDGGVVFDQPQVNTGQEVIRISPNNTYVFDAAGDAQTHIIYPNKRVGIEPNEVRKFPTLEAQIQKDVTNLIQFLQDRFGQQPDYCVELVEDWHGKFLTPPQWWLNALGMEQFQTLSPGTPYRATYVDGQFIIETGPRINFSRLEGVTANQGGDRFNIRIEDDTIVVVPTLSAQEADLYGDYPAAIRRIFYDMNADAQIFDISEFPEFQDFPAGTSFTAYADQSLENLIVINPANNITVSSDFILGEDFYAPANSRFVFEINSIRTLRITEQLLLASVYQNPWTPNIRPEILPQFMAGLRKTGHTSLFVDTKALVNGYEIHGYNPRVYYSTLIELAHREGIKVYAMQGDPNWSTPAGMSIAASYLNTLGNAAVDFDGFVLNVESQKLPGWASMAEQEKQIFVAEYSRSMQTLYSIIRTFSDYQRPVLSFVPQELQSTGGYSPVEQTVDVLVVNQTSVNDILMAIEQFNPSRPFQIMVETSLLSDADATFGMREDKMGGILQRTAQVLRANPQYGRFFQGFVINHDSGEDILNVMQTGQGRDISARIEDALLTDIDKPLMITSNIYEMLISGRQPYVVQAGEERPSSAEILRGTVVSRLEGMLRGFTGAANVDNMVQSVIQTIARDRFTLLPEAIPLGAEIGAFMAGANQLWGQQYTDQAVIESITIEGLDADANVVTVWDDIINNSVPIIVGRGSDITQFHVNVQINSAEGALSDFPGYLVFLTHHPD